VQNTVAILSLEAGAAILLWLVFVVIETAVLQFVNWGEFRTCLKASFLANLFSGIIVILSLIMIPRLGLAGLIAGVLLSIIIEGFVLLRLKPGAKRQSWLAAALANIASFLILIFPIFWYARGMI
jgi:hypothetical protein